MQRQIFTEEHDAFRDMVRAFIAKEITPYHEQWERDGIVSRDVWLAAGIGAPELYREANAEENAEHRPEPLFEEEENDILVELAERAAAG